MDSIKKPRSLPADLAGPIVRDPRALVRTQLRKATPEELIAAVVERAKSDRTFRSQLLTAVEPFRRGRGTTGKLPEGEDLLRQFETREWIIRENPKLFEGLVQWLCLPPKTAPSSKGARKITLAWFAQAHGVEPDSVGKALNRAKKN